MISAAGLLAAVALLLAAPGGSAATSLKACKLSPAKTAQLGASYVTLLKVHGATCTAAAAVAKSFNACRKEKGPTGRCTHKVRGYACTDTRPADLQLPTQINGHVKCRSASKRVNFDFEQLL